MTLLPEGCPRENLPAIWWLFRAGLAERVFGLAIKIAPRSYCPSWLEWVREAEDASAQGMW